MKKLTAFLFTGMLFLTTVALASFPVEKNKTQDKQELVLNQQNSVDAPHTGIDASAEMSELENNFESQDQSSTQIEEKWILVLLLVFLGGVAAHRWYARKPIGWNILFILTAGGCGVWLLVDLIHILTDQF